MLIGVLEETRIESGERPDKIFNLGRTNVLRHLTGEKKGEAWRVRREMPA